MAVPKVERLMNLVAALLHTRVPLSAATLRERVGGYPDDLVAFRRQFSRDKEDLRVMGVPIRLEPVPGADPPVDGYRIDPDEYYLPDPGLDADEFAALRLATRLVDVEPSEGSTGLSKLGGAVGTVDPSTTPWASVPTNPDLGVLFDAIQRERIVEFDYRGRRRRLAPLALGFQNGFWYVTGWDLTVEDDRVYRIDRIAGAVRETAEAAGPVRGARTLAPLEPWRIGGEDRVTVELRVDPVSVPGVIAQLGESRCEPVADDGSMRATLEVSNPDGFRSWLLDFGPTVVVTGPPAVRDDIVAWLDAVVEAAS